MNKERYKRHRDPAIQISLRFPKPALEKLERLSESAVQTKSQYVVKMIQDLPEPQK
jgi:hypothetical protein